MESGGQPSVMIEGAPTSIVAGTSIRLAALVVHDKPTVAWRASAGSMTPSGVYRAPLQPGRGAVDISATGTKGARDQRTITIIPAGTSRPAPAVPAPAASVPQPFLATPFSTIGSSSMAPVLPVPQAMLFNGRLVMTTTPGESGVVSLRAGLGSKALGGCVAKTPRHRSFTCQLNLGTIPRYASIRVMASLRVGTRIERSERPASVVPPMQLPVAGPLPPAAQLSPGWQFVCGA
jgi:hypothetical protein